MFKSCRKVNLYALRNYEHYEIERVNHRCIHSSAVKVVIGHFSVANLV